MASLIEQSISLSWVLLEYVLLFITSWPGSLRELCTIQTMQHLWLLTLLTQRLVKRGIIWGRIVLQEVLYRCTGRPGSLGSTLSSIQQFNKLTATSVSQILWFKVLFGKQYEEAYEQRACIQGQVSYRCGRRAMRARKLGRAVSSNLKEGSEWTKFKLIVTCVNYNPLWQAIWGTTRAERIQEQVFYRYGQSRRARKLGRAVSSNLKEGLEWTTNATSVIQSPLWQAIWWSIWVECKCCTVAEESRRARKLGRAVRWGRPAFAESRCKRRRPRRWGSRVYWLPDFLFSQSKFWGKELLENVVVLYSTVSGLRKCMFLCHIGNSAA